MSAASRNCAIGSLMRRARIIATARPNRIESATASATAAIERAAPRFASPTGMPFATGHPVLGRRV
jgi:hypothetical protein